MATASKLARYGAGEHVAGGVVLVDVARTDGSRAEPSRTLGSRL
jgi:hypothetical protein